MCRYLALLYERFMRLAMGLNVAGAWAGATAACAITPACAPDL